MHVTNIRLIGLLLLSTKTIIMLTVCTTTSAGEEALPHVMSIIYAEISAIVLSLDCLR